MGEDVGEEPAYIIDVSDDASHLEGTGSSLAEDTTAKTDQHPDNPEPSRKPRQPRQKKTDRVDEMCKLAVHTCTF